MPSCVAFRGNRTIIGDKALDYLEKDAENVCMLFKRKMGTQETYFIPSINKEVSPIELSSLIIKELKNFVSDTDQLQTAVITIPASFDTIQSNATKKAGYLAGFKEVVLLQEPIAACLAFANQSNLDIQSSKNWIVYDFGGGTFDVALVEVNDRELKVIDNEGDNFLGGADFDNLIVEKIIVPKIEAKANVTNLFKDIKTKSGQYKGLYFELLNKASKTILKNSDANLIINIVEGQSKGLPSSGLSIGYIEFSGKDLEDDLIKGTDIEIELEITESRDLKINVYLQACDQEFKNVFSQSERAISISKINMEINAVLSEVEHLIREQVEDENFEYSNTLEQLRVGLIEVQIETTLLDDNDVSDQKYQLDDKKRKLIQAFDTLTRNKIIALEIEANNQSKEAIEWEVNKDENEKYRHKYLKVIANEKEVINSGDKYLIKAKIKELDILYNSIIQSSDENFIGYYI